MGPHELSDFNKQTQVAICQKLLQKHAEESFLDRIVTCDEKWVYYDNFAKRTSSVKDGGRAQTVAKRTLTNRKVLLSVWWDKDGIIFYDFLPSGQAVNGDIYRSYLEKVQINLIEKRPHLVNRKGVIFHQDNARPHTAALTIEKIVNDFNWELLPHPPYSPDLAPSDYYLFLCLQNFLSGGKYQNAQEVKNDVISYFDSRKKEFFNHGILKLTQRWADVVALKGDYLCN